MFDLEDFVASCRAALAEDAGGHRAVRELLTRTVGEPGRVMAGLGEPQGRDPPRCTAPPT